MYKLYADVNSDEQMILALRKFRVKVLSCINKLKDLTEDLTDISDILETYDMSNEHFPESFRELIYYISKTKDSFSNSKFINNLLSLDGCLDDYLNDVESYPEV